MTSRAYRLLAPGVAFSVVGLLVLLAGGDNDFRLRGGLVVTGLYGLATQIVLSMLLVASIDDFSDRGRAQRSTRHGLAERYNEPAGSYGLSRALPRFYASFAGPMALFAFGFGAVVSAMVDGALASHGFTASGWHPSEIILFGIMLGGVAWLLLQGNVGGFCGWCLGFAVAASFGQVRFVAGTRASTPAMWSAIAAVLCALRVLWWAVLAARRRLAQRRRATPRTA